jgi:hypothetical protein
LGLKGAWRCLFEAVGGCLDLRQTSLSGKALHHWQCWSCSWGCVLPSSGHITCARAPADALRRVSEDERRERFSFALARKLDLGQEELQQLMYSQVRAVLHDPYCRPTAVLWIGKRQEAVADPMPFHSCACCTTLTLRLIAMHPWS